MTDADELTQLREISRVAQIAVNAWRAGVAAASEADRLEQLLVRYRETREAAEIQKRIEDQAASTSS